MLLRKGIYPYEHMDSWNKFNETRLPNKKDFYGSLNMEGITDIDYRNAKYIYIFRGLNNKNIGDYHELYVESDPWLLADVFENFRKKCIEIYELDPAHVLSAPGLAWQACLKNTGTKLELLTDINIFLITKKGFEVGICHAIHRYTESNNKCMKSYDKNKESSYLMYLDWNNLCGWEMSQKLLVNSFEWKANVSRFDEDPIIIDL